MKRRRPGGGQSVASAGILPMSLALTSKRRRLLTANTCPLPEGSPTPTALSGHGDTLGSSSGQAQSAGELLYLEAVLQ